MDAAEAVLSYCLHTGPGSWATAQRLRLTYITMIGGIQVILVVSVLVPLLGLGFAYFSYGKLWG